MAPFDFLSIALIAAAFIVIALSTIQVLSKQISAFRYVVIVAGTWLVFTISMELFPGLEVSAALLFWEVFNLNNDSLQLATELGMSQTRAGLFQQAIDEGLDLYWKLSAFTGVLLVTVVVANYLIHRKDSDPFNWRRK